MKGDLFSPLFSPNSNSVSVYLYRCFIPSENQRQPQLIAAKDIYNIESIITFHTPSSVKQFLCFMRILTFGWSKSPGFNLCGVISVVIVCTWLMFNTIRVT